MGIRSETATEQRNGYNGRMDIDYLLFLQQLRESLGSVPESILVTLSDFGGGAVVLGLCLLIYWGVDKQTGIFALMCFNVGNFVNQFLKNLACVYRPWVRDPRVVPAPAAIDGATGYSFPSGHTVSTTTIFGSFTARTWNKRRWLSVICICVIAIVAFSRNYLGVHTPQDVLVGLAEGIVVVIVGCKVAPWLHEHREKDWLIVALAFVLGAAVLVVINLKPYPMDYVDGVLLVDPEDMKKDCFEGVGLFCGAWLAWCCERRWVNFETAGAPPAERAIRVLFGLVLALAIMTALDPMLKAVLGLNWAKLVSRFLLMLVTIFVGPWLAKLVIDRRNRRTELVEAPAVEVFGAEETPSAGMSAAEAPAAETSATTTPTLDRTPADADTA